MIRSALKSDAKDIAKLLSTFGNEIFDMTGTVINTDEKQIDELFHKYLDDKFRAYVYELENKIVGFITFTDTFSLYAKGKYIIITELYVASNYRNKNIGKKLLDEVIILAKSETKTRIELTTPPIPQFQKSLEFYLQNGFEITGGKKVKYEL